MADARAEMPDDANALKWQKDPWPRNSEKPKGIEVLLLAVPEAARFNKSDSLFDHLLVAHDKSVVQREFNKIRHPLNLRACHADFPVVWFWQAP